MLGKTHFAFYQTQHLKNRLRHLTNLNPAILPIPMAAHILCAYAGAHVHLARPLPFPGLFRGTYWIVGDRLIPWALQEWLSVSLFLDLFSNSKAWAPGAKSSHLSRPMGHAPFLSPVFSPHWVLDSFSPFFLFSLQCGWDQCSNTDLFPAKQLTALYLSAVSTISS